MGRHRQVPDYCRRSAACCSANVRQCRSRTGSAALGIYVGLNVAADWDPRLMCAARLRGRMSRIERGCDNHCPANDRPELPHLAEGATIDKTRSFLNTPGIGAGVRFGRKIRCSGAIGRRSHGGPLPIFKKASPGLADHRMCGRQDVAQPPPIRRLWPSCSQTDFSLSQGGVLERTAAQLENTRPWQNHRIRSSAFHRPSGVHPLGRSIDRLPTCSAAMLDPFAAGSSKARQPIDQGLGNQCSWQHPVSQRRHCAPTFSENKPPPAPADPVCG